MPWKMLLEPQLKKHILLLLKLELIHQQRHLQLLKLQVVQ